jgi:hypothetical protein
VGVAVQGGIVPFDDLAGQSPTINFTRDSRSATRTGKVAWANIDALFIECYPTASGLPGVYPGVSYLFVDSVDVKPFNPGGDKSPTCTGNVIVPVEALVTINYSKLPYEYESSTFLSRRWSFSGEFMTLPASSVKWIGPPAVPVVNEEISAAKIIPTIEHSLSRQRATSIPWTAIKNCIGKVNESAIDNGTFDDVPAESLLCLGSQIDWTFSTDGTQIWNLEHRFQERLVKQGSSTYGWNHFWRPDTKAWEKLVDDSGNTIYPTVSTSDLMDLFD